MKKRTLAVILALVMILSLAACGGKTNTPAATEHPRKAAGELIAGIAQDLDESLNPYQMVSAGEKEILTNVYEGLYKVAPSGDYIPAVAESYTVSEDGTVCTDKPRCCHLRLN